MNEAELKKKQFETLDYFYKNTVQTKVVTRDIVALVCDLILLAVMMILPGDKMLGIWWCILFFGTCGAIWGISPYIGVNQRGQYWFVSWKLQNLPISLRTIREFRFRRFLKFQTRLYLPLQILHIIANLIRVHQISWEDFLYPFLFIFVIPVIITGIYSRWLP